MDNSICSPHWLDLAESRADSVHNPKLFIGAGLGGALILGSLLNPLTAVVALGWGLWCAWGANERNSDQSEAVQEGLVAHLLDRKQLKQYLLDVGEIRVVTELGQAIGRELKMTDAATKLARHYGLFDEEVPEERPVELPPVLNEIETESTNEPPEPEYELPVTWQVITDDDYPQMEQVWPHAQARTTGSSITEPGSAISVISEPTPEINRVSAIDDDEPPPSNAVTTTGSDDAIEVIDLMSLTPFESVGPIRSDEFRLFQILKDRKKKQTEIVQILYHTKRGGTEAYEKARGRYMVLLKTYTEINK